MNSIDGFKTCRKGLHQYPADKRECTQCKKQRERRWREQNRTQDLQRKQIWREQNLERRREYSLQWRKRNSNKTKQYIRIWRENNRDKERIRSGYRRARQKQATPAWANHAEINAIYAEAARLEKETGIAHHVDHIYPLANPYLCGLHVAENLQIIPAVDNILKSNRSWPGQLDCQKDRNPTFLTKT